MDCERLAQILFREELKEPEYYERLYPERDLAEGAKVTRFAPSPTGSLHIGGLFAALTAQRTAAQSGGVFYLRIEDTDKKREISGGLAGIVEGLSDFGIVPDEGVFSDGSERGAYGPYVQSKRREIYHCFARELVRKGLAYPCFCTQEELSSLRARQEAKGLNPGYYGEYARCRRLGTDEIEKRIEAGEPYVLRFRAEDGEGELSFDDLIRGRLSLNKNMTDIVLLKTDGLPTYHFAHCVDDHLMRTTHVIRGDEWISSLPAHIQLFRACGFKVPKYAHIAPIMKLDGDSKRKLSKRKDAEAAVSFYKEKGYPREALIEYLLTLANSDFEEKRRAMPDAELSEFPLRLKKMSVSGALFDLKKLNDISKTVISKMTAEQVLERVLLWAADYDERLCLLLKGDTEKAKKIFALGRGGAKPRKDLAVWSEVPDYLSYFYDETYREKLSPPKNISREDAAKILSAYREKCSADCDAGSWFEGLRAICGPLGFAPDVKSFKACPDGFKGHVGDVSAVLRLALTGRENTPDLYEIIKILGAEKVLHRLDRAIGAFGGKENG